MNPRKVVLSGVKPHNSFEALAICVESAGWGEDHLKVILLCGVASAIATLAAEDLIDGNAIFGVWRPIVQMVSCGPPASPLLAPPVAKSDELDTLLSHSAPVPLSNSWVMS
ncbi:MAG: hypothetical protein L0Y56_03875 [Nitrospira sp.]|nr:hypothetical protein [Nitrospira sp.]